MILQSFSLIFELLGLVCSFYFKNTRIFFIILSLILAKMAYFYTSVYQANLFIFSFLPLVFGIFAFKKQGVLILEKANLSFVLVLILYQIISFFLAKNTSFISEISSLRLGFFTPLSSLGFVFFILITILLLLRAFKSMDFWLVAAFLIGFFPFLFEGFAGLKFTEFSSLILLISLLAKAYKDAFYDSLTKMKNEKALKRFIKGKNEYFIALLHFSEFEKTQEAYVKLILRQISKKLRKLRADIFTLGFDFVLIFDDEKTALKHLAFLESMLKNLKLNIENESFDIDFKITLIQNKNDISLSLKELRQSVKN